MNIEQVRLGGAGGRRGDLSGSPDVVLVFGSRAALQADGWIEALRDRYGAAPLVGCSTAGEIFGVEVADDTLVATAVQMERSQLIVSRVALEGPGASRETGRRLGAQLPNAGLVHVFVLSDGQGVNGSELVRGLVDALPDGVGITGGLAGDGARFELTLVVAGDVPRSGDVVAVGFYGNGIRVSHGSFGGWDPFGPSRLITRSEGNVLHELDGQPALALYRRFLGDHADQLPAASLRFPLGVEQPDGTELVRTVLGLDEASQTMTFAGDVPQGSSARLMMANADRLIDGAHEAAMRCREAMGSPPELALLVSCVGRRLVLGQRTEEEVEAVQAALSQSAVLAGFYSYGEICPQAKGRAPDLHNQTMTITGISER